MGAIALLHPTPHTSAAPPVHSPAAFSLDGTLQGGNGKYAESSGGDSRPMETGALGARTSRPKQLGLNIFEKGQFPLAGLVVVANNP